MKALKLLTGHLSEITISFWKLPFSFKEMGKISSLKVVRLECSFWDNQSLPSSKLSSFSCRISRFSSVIVRILFIKSLSKCSSLKFLLNWIRMSLLSSSRISVGTHPFFTSELWKIIERIKIQIFSTFCS